MALVPFDDRVHRFLHRYLGLDVEVRRERSDDVRFDVHRHHDDLFLVRQVLEGRFHVGEYLVFEAFPGVRGKLPAFARYEIDGDRRAGTARRVFPVGRDGSAFRSRHGRVDVGGFVVVFVPGPHQTLDVIDDFVSVHLFILKSTRNT